MVDSLVTKKLARAFPNSFINTALEFIAHKEANEYFRLEDCNNEFDVKCKVLEWLSRGAHKTCPFHTNLKNERFHNFMLNGINDFLETDFTEDDIAIIYQKLGNRVRHSLTEEFVNSDYDMSVLKGGEG
jgi:hypothetical protein